MLQWKIRVGGREKLVQQAALQLTCHSEPVTDVTGVGISFVIVTSFFYRWGLPPKTALLYRNDGEIRASMTGKADGVRPPAPALHRIKQILI